MKKLLLIVVCLIALFPRAEWQETSSEDKVAILQQLIVIYGEEHPACKRVKIEVAETPNFKGFKLTCPKEGI